MKKGMIKVSVLYPNGEGSKFNIDYYCNVHAPMVADLMGDLLKGAAIENGIGGPEPGSAPAFLAMGHLYFDSLEAFQKAFGPNAEKIMGDLPNFTNTEPQMVISEVMA